MNAAIAAFAHRPSSKGRNNRVMARKLDFEGNIPARSISSCCSHCSYWSAPFCSYIFFVNSAIGRCQHPPALPGQAPSQNAARRHLFRQVVGDPFLWPSPSLLRSAETHCTIDWALTSVHLLHSNPPIAMRQPGNCRWRLILPTHSLPRSHLTDRDPGAKISNASEVIAKSQGVTARHTQPRPPGM